MRTPNLKALKAFDAAARHLNFRRAGDELHVTQGAVAQQVRGLEADLGTRLFDRRARGLALTAEGRRFHTAIARALAIIGEATRAIRPEPRRITLSLPPSLAAKWLMPRLARFSMAHPGIDLATEASERLSDLARDGIDIAIRQGARPAGTGVAVETLAPVALTAVASPDLAARIGTSRDRGGSPLEGFSTVSIAEDGHGHWARLYGEAGLPLPDRVLRFNQTALAMDAALNGQAVALVPALLAASDLAAGRLAALWRAPDLPADAGFHILSSVGPRAPAETRAVIDWLKAEAEAALPV